MRKCIVHGCENRTGQGYFIGDLCCPCYHMLQSGSITYGDTFIHKQQAKIKKLEGCLSDIESSFLKMRGDTK